MNRNPGHGDALDIFGGWVPSPGEIADYRADGYLISPAIVPDALLDGAWRAIQRFMAGERDQAIVAAASASDRHLADGEPIEQLGYLALQMDAVRTLARFAPLARAAAALAGCTVIRLFHDRTIIKPPRRVAAAALGWHTDRAYWRTCSSEDLLTAWIPFQDVDTATGGLMVVKGSHLWSGTDHLATAHCDIDEIEREIRLNGRRFIASPMAMKRGQVSFHHCRAIHGSHANAGGRPRIALALHLQPGGNCYQAAADRDGRPIGHTNELICRRTPAGDPDYADPDVFLQLWPPATG